MSVGQAHRQSGRVLAGIQSDDPAQLEAHLAAIGYDYSEETDNSAYQRFMKIG